MTASLAAAMLPLIFDHQSSGLMYTDSYAPRQAESGAHPHIWGTVALKLLKSMLFLS